MSETAAPAAIGEVRSASQVLREDVMCQSFIQGSSTLAYACVLIRRGQYELAGHVLKRLDGRKAGRYRDIVFYLQSQIDIETGMHGAVKARLVSRLREQPADAVALSLLQACIQAELLAHPEPDPVPPVEVKPAPPEVAPAPWVAPIAQAVGVAAPVAQPARQAQAPLPAPPEFEASPVAVAAAPFVEPPSPQTLKFPEIKAVRTGRDSSASADVDLVPFQPVIQDGGTRAFCLWDLRTSDSRKEVRDAKLAEMVDTLPQALPGTLGQAVASLDAGRILKICLSFQNMTVTTLHQGELNCGLVTGPLNQSLIAIVRTETLFTKRAGQLTQAQAGERDGAG